MKRLKIQILPLTLAPDHYATVSMRSSTNSENVGLSSTSSCFQIVSYLTSYYHMEVILGISVTYQQDRGRATRLQPHPPLSENSI
jgi:hypothetical protein